MRLTHSAWDSRIWGFSHALPLEDYISHAGKYSNSRTIIFNWWPRMYSLDKYLITNQSARPKRLSVRRIDRWWHVPWGPGGGGFERSSQVTFTPVLRIFIRHLIFLFNLQVNNSGRWRKVLRNDTRLWINYARLIIYMVKSSKRPSRHPSHRLSVTMASQLPLNLHPILVLFWKWPWALSSENTVWIEYSTGVGELWCMLSAKRLCMHVYM